ncbi:MAG: hypothetical protein OXG37_00045 [Actinomycetia bacterium]|nr:hypothetical protein [Actinomycetes bacterium]
MAGDASERKETTDGGLLELVSEFDVTSAGEVAPRERPAHEWYEVLSGNGVIASYDEESAVGPGGFMPPLTNLILSLSGGSETIRCLCIAIGSLGLPRSTPLTPREALVGAAASEGAEPAACYPSTSR